jgi:hypothetical protein
VASNSTSEHSTDFEELVALRALGVPLEGAEEAAFTRHCVTCPVCVTLIERDQVALRSLLTAAPALEPSPELRTRILARATAELDERRPASATRLHTVNGQLGTSPNAGRRPRPLPRRGAWRGPLALAASVLVVFGIGVAIARWTQAGGTPQTVLTADAPSVSSTGALPTSAPAVSITPTSAASPPRAGQTTVSTVGSVAAAPGTAEPVQTVQTFYALLGQRRYEDVVAVLSPKLRAAAPWQPDVLRDRTPPGDLVVEQANLVQLDQENQRATVSVVVRETIPPPLSQTRHYVGTWQLVRGANGWLLDQSDLQLE